MLDEDDGCSEAEDDCNDGYSASGLVSDDEDFKASVKTRHTTARNTHDSVHALLIRVAISRPLPKNLDLLKFSPNLLPERQFI
jgi:hypothetical protein